MDKGITNRGIAYPEAAQDGTSHTTGTHGIAILDNDATSIALVAGFLRSLLPDMSLIWTTTDGYDAIDRCLEPRTRPSLLLCDMSLTGISGPRVCRVLRERGTNPLLLAITSFPIGQYASLAAQAGCQGILEKSLIPQQIVEAADRLLHDRTYHPTDVTGFETAEEAHRRLRLTHGSAAAMLSYREMQVMDGLLDGLSLKDIAGRLHVSDATVRTHISHVKRKLGASNLSQASIRWYRMREELA